MTASDTLTNPDYGRPPKDRSLRFEVQVNHDTVVPGGSYVGVRQVGSSYAPFRSVVLFDGTVYEYTDPRAPVEAGKAIDKARLTMLALSSKRKSNRSK